MQKKLVKYTDEDVSRLLQEIEVLKKERLGGHHRLPNWPPMSPWKICYQDFAAEIDPFCSTALRLYYYHWICLCFSVRPTHQLGQIVLACLLMLLLWQQTLRCSLSTTWRAPSVC